MTKVLPIAVLVSGNGTNLQAIIDSIESKKLDADIRIVISNNPNAFAIKRCQKHKIKSEVCKSEDDITKVIDESGAELICLAGFMRILSPRFVSKFSGCIMNIHPALLPSFPGLHAQRQALEHGVKFSGCTIHFVNEGVDAGPIILQAVVPVLASDTEETLTARILTEEHKIYSQAIQLFAEGKLKIEGRSVLITDKK